MRADCVSLLHETARRLQGVALCIVATTIGNGHSVARILKALTGDGQLKLVGEILTCVTLPATILPFWRLLMIMLSVIGT